MKKKIIFKFKFENFAHNKINELTDYLHILDKICLIFSKDIQHVLHYDIC